MQGTVKMAEIMVEIPAEMAGVLSEKIKKVVGAYGTVTVDSLVDGERLAPGETLKLYREDAEYTQEELAAMLRKQGRKTTQEYISKMEKGSKPISKKMATLLADIFQTGHKVFL